ncbi:MAG TPA: response regulator [Fervidobacterium sp.]|nr:response regulator [Fervidobacterium sp.]HOM74353.1 response regulator [Fervidobacterium sp.]
MKKVLVIDDSDVWRSYLKSLIETNKNTVEVAKDGLEGINKFFTFLPDVVVVDYVMPKLNGIHFTRFIRSFQAFKNVGILMLTGVDETINPFWAKRSGANAFLKKTISQEEIEKTILDFISQPYSIEWSREIYKMHTEPFGELVDILEESLKHSTIIQEILELTPYVFDEELVLKKIYNLFSEMFEFEVCYFAISSLSTLRTYGFGQNPIAFPDDLKEVIARISDISSYINFEEHFTGTRHLKCEYVIETVYFNEDLLGFIIIESPTAPEFVQRSLLSLSDTLGTVFNVLNDYRNLSRNHDIDEATGACNSTYLRSRISYAMNFAQRNDIPLSFVKLRINNLREIILKYGGIAANEILRSVAKQLMIRAQDLVGRISFNEFFCVLIGSNKQKAEALFEAIKDDISNIELATSLGQQTKIDISVSIFEWQGETLGEIVENIF